MSKYFSNLNINQINNLVIYASSFICILVYQTLI
nr:MAG TPA: hypothetical protein [Crassvirales sp.]